MGPPLNTTLSQATQQHLAQEGDVVCGPAVEERDLEQVEDRQS